MIKNRDREVALQQKLGIKVKVLRAFGATVALGAIILVFLYPVISLLGLGFGRISSGTTQILAQETTWQALKQTIYLASVATGLATGLGIFLAGALYRYRVWGKEFFQFALTLPFVLPTIGVASAFKVLFSAEGYLGFLGWEHSNQAVIAAMVFYNTALVARTLGPIWVRLDQASIEVARSLGANPRQVFLRVVLPQLGGAIASAGALVFLYCCSSYSLVMVLGGVGVTTLEKEIYTLTNIDLDLGGAAVLSFLQIIVVALALSLSTFLQKKASRCLSLQAKPLYLPKTSSSYIHIFCSYLVIFIGFMLPIWQVVWRSLHRSGSFTFANYGDLFNPDSSILLDGSVGEALKFSLMSAVQGGVIATLLGTLVALLVSAPGRKKWRLLMQGIDHLYMLPLGISSVTIGLGLLVSLAAPPWNLAESGLLLPLAQALVAVPVVLRVVKPALQGIDQDLRTTSALCGASPLQVWWENDRRILQLAGGSAFAFAFAICLGEFGAASFLVMPEKLTLPVLIYRLQISAGAVENGMATAAAVVLCLVNGIVMSLAQKLFQSDPQALLKDRT